MRTSTFFSLLTPLLLAFQVHAATLVATTDEPIGGYHPGDLVTITLTGTTVPYQVVALGPVDLAESIDVRIVGAGFTAVSAETGTGGTCVAVTGCIVGAGYSVGGTQGSTVGGNFVAFSQIGGLVAGQLTNHMTVGVPFYTGESSLTAVFTTIAGAPGIYPAVNPIEMSDVGVGFFGITGPQTLGSYTVVPEPATASLLALGLLGLAMRRWE